MCWWCSVTIFFLSLSPPLLFPLCLLDGASRRMGVKHARACARASSWSFFFFFLKSTKTFASSFYSLGTTSAARRLLDQSPSRDITHTSTGPSFIPPEEEEDAGTSTIPPPPLLLPLTLWYIAWRLGHDGSFFSAVRSSSSSSSSSISKERKESRGCRYCRPIGPWWK